MTKYPIERLRRCIDIIRSSDVFRVALSRISGEVDPKLGDSSVLAKAFRRNGLERPMFYLGHRAPPFSHGSTMCLDVPVDWEDDGEETGRVAQNEGVAQVAQPVEFRQHGGTTRIMVLPDMHFPFADALVWSTMLNVVRGARPDVVVIIGDWIDCYSISEFPKTPDRVMNLKDEVDAGGEALDELIALRVPRIVWTEGNHEDRLTRTILNKNPALWGYVQTIPEYLKLAEKGVEWVPYKRWIKIGKFAFTHEVGYCGVNTARQSLLAFGNNVVIGHSHRASVVYSGNTEGDRHVAINVGWGGDFSKVDYGYKSQQVREWQHAFGWIVQNDDGCGWGTVIPIIDGSCVVDGRVISGRREAA